MRWGGGETQALATAGRQSGKYAQKGCSGASMRARSAREERAWLSTPRNSSFLWQAVVEVPQSEAMDCTPSPPQTPPIMAPIGAEDVLAWVGSSGDGGGGGGGGGESGVEGSVAMRSRRSTAEYANSLLTAS